MLSCDAKDMKNTCSPWFCWASILLRWVSLLASSCSSWLTSAGADAVLLLRWMECECHWFHSSLLISYFGPWDCWSWKTEEDIHVRAGTMSLQLWIICKTSKMSDQTRVSGKRNKGETVQPELWGGRKWSDPNLKLVFVAGRQTQVDFHLCISAD